MWPDLKKQILAVSSLSDPLSKSKFLSLIRSFCYRFHRTSGCHRHDIGTQGDLYLESGGYFQAVPSQIVRDRHALIHSYNLKPGSKSNAFAWVNFEPDLLS
jgi:hypothetical protein